jgi:chorismate mutase
MKGVTVAVRALRGATRLQADDPVEMTSAVEELVGQMLARNSLSSDALISMIFTSTPDLVCMFPAAAARGLGLGDVPLICAQEIAVPGALSQVVRVLAHVELDRPRSEIVHVYLRGAEVLRQDLAQ